MVPLSAQQRRNGRLCLLRSHHLSRHASARAGAAAHAAGSCGGLVRTPRAYHNNARQLPDGNFAQRPSDDPTGIRRVVTQILLEQRRVPIKSDRGLLRKFLQKHVWGLSSSPERWAQRGRQPLVTKGGMEALADEWFNDPSKGDVIEEPDLVALLKELRQKRQSTAGTRRRYEYVRM